MIVVTANTTIEYYFFFCLEEKIENYANENSLSIKDAIYDLIDQGELDLEMDSAHESIDYSKIIQAEKFE